MWKKYWFEQNIYIYLYPYFCVWEKNKHTKVGLKFSVRLVYFFLVTPETPEHHVLRFRESIKNTDKWDRWINAKHRLPLEVREQMQIWNFWNKETKL